MKKALLFLSLLAFGAAQGQTVQENFTGTGAPGWTIEGTRWDVPSAHAGLTAAMGIDPPGSGWLRLTDLGGDESGEARYTGGSFNPQKGLIISFDYVSWGAPYGSNADGLSFYLYDATKDMSNSRFGASLGYCGGAGGYIGIGLDEWGNFALKNGDAQMCDPVNFSGSGRKPQQVTVRGPTRYGNSSALKDDGTPIGFTGYNEYITSVAPLGLIDNPETSTRPTPDQAKVVLIPNGRGGYRLTVELNQGGTGWQTIINNIDYNYAAPAQMSIGFSASTGAAYNIHEVRQVMVKTPVDLSVKKTAIPQTSGNGVSYQIEVESLDTNPIDAGVQANDITPDNAPRILDQLPAELTNVSWSCVASSGSVCPAASGTGNIDTTNYTLKGGGKLSFTIDAQLSPEACGKVITNTASVLFQDSTTLADAHPENDSQSASIQAQSCGNPELSLKKVVRELPDGKFDNFSKVSPGQSVEYCLYYQNTGNASAKNVSITDALPEALTPQNPSAPTPEEQWKLSLHAGTDPSGQNTLPPTIPLPAGASWQVSPAAPPQQSIILSMPELATGASGLLCFQGRVP